MLQRICSRAKNIGVPPLSTNNVSQQNPSECLPYTTVALTAVPDFSIAMPMLLVIFASGFPIIYYVRNTEEQQRRNFWAFKQQISRIELTKSEMLALVTEKERLSQALSSKQRELDARCGPS